VFPAEAENRPKSAHRYNVAEQQLIYKSEIERIWKAQFDSLSRKDEPQLSDEEDKKEPIRKPPPQPQAGPSARPSPAFSRASSMERDREGSMGPDGSRSVLRIKRLVNNFLPHYSAPHFSPNVISSISRSTAYGRPKSSGTKPSSAPTYAVARH